MSFQLSDVQQRIVNHNRGHLRIVACPGSGKTETVSHRIAQMIADGEEPSQIVAFTFTKKAAENLRHRIRSQLEKKSSRKDFGDMYVGTIDAFCLHLLKILKPEYKSFEVLDESRKIAFLERWYWELGLHVLARNDGAGKWKTLEKFSRTLDIVVNERVDVNLITDNQFVRCHANYVQKLHDERFFDYASVITTLLGIIENNEEVAKDLHSKIKHVVFDEYQDVNLLQESLLELLSVESKSVCVVGDDDQNIFQWRGSNVQHILEFPEKYKSYGVDTEELGINYRSTDSLVDASRQFIERNENRVRKNITSFDQQTRHFENGDLVSRQFETDTEEFGFIADEIERLVDSDFTDKHGNTFALSLKDFAILVRTNNDASRITNYLRERGISIVTESGSSVFATPEVELAMDCIFFAFSTEGYSTQETPVLDKLVQRFIKIFGKSNEKYFQEGLLQIRERAERIILKGQNDYLPNLGLQEFFQRVLSAMGAEKTTFEDNMMFHLGILSKTISDYEYVYQSLRARQVGGLKWYVRQYAEKQYGDPSHLDPTMIDSVKVLTIYKAKGLEFPVVFLPSFVESGRGRRNSLFVDDTLYPAERYAASEEDNRRVYYTAITRSQKYLYITCAQMREINAPRQNPRVTANSPNHFIKEIVTGSFSDAGNGNLITSGLSIAPPENGIFPTTYSKMEIFEKCPHDYRLRDVMGFNAGVPSAFGYGTNIHNIINVIHSNYITKKIIPNDQQIEKLFNSMFYLRFAPGPQNDVFKNAGIKVVKNYVDVHRQDFQRILETEKRFELVYKDSIITGDIDLLKKVDPAGKTMQVEIIDFKTDRQNRDGQYDVDYSNQVRFYAFATRESLGYVPETAIIHHLDNDTTESIDVSESAQNKTMKMIDGRVHLILEGNFKPKPEKNRCAGCDFRSICPHKEFTVGVNFEPTKSSEKTGKSVSQKIQEEHNDETESTTPIVSEGIMARATVLAKNNVTQNGDGTFTVNSTTDPNKTYKIRDMQCTCRGFIDYFRRHPGTNSTCSHVEAVKIFQNNDNT
jgi:DNA helicase II / ATP-dependent DNA helicase PcrA